MKYYTLEMLEGAYSREYPDMPEHVIKEKAKQLHRKMNTLDIYWKRSNRRFYQNNDLM
ncbi:hypothetical protein [Sporomusa aerivorans]|uniref:hypothetical protein n=1 Tax=Sporomusa aerivorans TaxID=204936 RepID=UPI00352B2A70